MLQNFYRLDLNDLADWLYHPMYGLSRQFNLPYPTEAQLLDLAELIVDYDLNSRLSWSDHSCSYRQADFLRLLGDVWQQNDDYYCAFDEIMSCVSEYLTPRWTTFMGRAWGCNHVFELRRMFGTLLIIDLGPVPQKQIRKPVSRKGYQQVGGLAIRRYPNGTASISLLVPKRNPRVVPMGTINVRVEQPTARTQPQPDDLTNEQYEWLAEVDRLRAAYHKAHPSAPTSGAKLRAGEKFQRKRSVLRSKLGTIRSNPDDLYVNPVSRIIEILSSRKLDDGQVRDSAERGTSPLRPVPRKRRPNRNERSRRNKDKSHG